MKNARILIATVTAGAGHVQAAAALEEAWRAEYPADVVERWDVLSFAPRLVRRAYSEGYLSLVKHAPEIYARVFRRTDDAGLARRAMPRRQLLGRAMARPFLERARAFAPDVVLATHFLPMEVLGGWLGGAAAPRPTVGVVVTDFEAHALWHHDRVDRYYVAMDSTAARMRARGVPSRALRVTGIPIAGRFRKAMSRPALRRRHGLDLRRPTLLVLGGGFGLGPVRELLAELDRVSRPLQVLVVAGKNEALRRDVARRRGRHDVRALGFVDNMEEWMTLADLVVSKPGGLTTSESLALGRPMLILDPIPGQEAANSDLLLEKGAAWKLSRLEDLPARLDELLRRGVLPRLAARAKALGRPRAALDIVRDLRGARAKTETGL